MKTIAKLALFGACVLVIGCADYGPEDLGMEGWESDLIDLEESFDDDPLPSVHNPMGAAKADGVHVFRPVRPEIDEEELEEEEERGACSTCAPLLPKRSVGHGTPQPWRMDNDE